MEKDKALKILIIVGFCTIILTPLSLAIMWFFTDWKKKTKIIFSAVAAGLYAATIALVLFLVLTPQAQQNTGRYGSSNTEFSFSEGGGGSGFLPSDSGKGSGKKSKDKKSESKGNGSSSSSAAQTNFKRVLLPILFFLAIIALVIVQNLRSKKKSVYENPYVDTKKYVLPLAPDFKFPMVHFPRLELGSDEKILYVTETNQSENEGDFVITNKRCVILTKKENVEIPLEALNGVSSISSTVIQLNSQEEKYYVFMAESQVKYALAVIKWLGK